jgi:translation initiation factor 1
MTHKNTLLFATSPKGKEKYRIFGPTLNKIIMKNNDWKDRLNVVYSTNPDFQYESTEEEELETLPKNQQKLSISMEKKGRGGKTVTLVRGFIGTGDDLKELGKLLKTKCGVGGSVKDEEIIIQGDFKQRIIDLLKTEGYTQTK